MAAGNSSGGEEKPGGGFAQRGFRCRLRLRRTIDQQIHKVFKEAKNFKGRKTATAKWTERREGTEGDEGDEGKLLQFKGKLPTSRVVEGISNENEGKSVTAMENYR